MSSVAIRPSGRWEARWRSADKRSHKLVFDTESEARGFLQDIGAPLARRPGSKRRTRTQVINHIAASFEIDEAGCWVWTRSLTNAGYARLNWKHLGEVNVPGGHRVVLAAIGQPVPSDKVVDHLCRNRACINPDHLDVVQQRENVLRSPIAQGALNAAKTHCPQGHPYSPENTYTWHSVKRHFTARQCRACQRAYRERRRAARAGVAA